MTSQGKENDGAWLLPSLQRGVIVMTDYEMLALVLMIIAIVVSLINKNDK